MLTPIHASEKLSTSRKGGRKCATSLLQQAKAILKQEALHEEDIWYRLRHTSQQSLDPLPDIPEQDNIFSLQDIKELCLKYRLRFLDAYLFRGQIPQEAIFKIKKIEKKYGCRFPLFKIMAPKEMFNLTDRNKDPLLFAALNQDRYLFLYKWGSDIPVLRRWIVFPFRSVKNFLLCSFIFSLLIALFLPISYPVKLLVILTLTLFWIVVYACVGYLWLEQDFSENEWNSTYIV